MRDRTIPEERDHDVVASLLPEAPSHPDRNG
jgi:hypothetical protein